LAVVADFTRVIPELKSKSLLFVHLTFWLTALLCTLLVLTWKKQAEATVTMEASTWQLNWKAGLIWATIPVLLFALAKMSVSMHSEPLPGSHLRFDAAQK
jgi:hypothetical protein